MINALQLTKSALNHLTATRYKFKKTYKYKILKKSNPRYPVNRPHIAQGCTYKYM